MSDIAIKAENISKQYRIGLKEELHDSLIGKVGSFLKSPLSNMAQLKKLSHFESGQDREDIIWALKDVSFEVKRGEVLGIIGANGAGKSTLLKILAQITQPSSGQIQLNGRVASLLEVGTGMHPDLTGRENIYLNGTILGMTKKEIDSKLDEIIDFSGVEKFIDTPVKRFSSGMSVRLGFSVSAHLDPEIMLVDEVLAVGDVQFRNKCLQKMKDVSLTGRTVLFISHNMAAIRQLCNKCILIENGILREVGQTESIVQSYLNQYLDFEQNNFHSKQIDQQKDVQLVKACITDIAGTERNNFTCDDPFIIQFAYNVKNKIPGLYAYLGISRDDGTTVLVSISNDMTDDPINDLAVGQCVVEVTIPPRILGHGKYHVSVSLASPQNIKGFLIDTPGRVATFSLSDYSTIRGNDRDGFLSTLLSWDVK